MRIAAICPHFAPDVAPTGEVMTSIALELAARGHRLDVVTALPWYLDHAVEPGWDGQIARREQTAWGTVTRLHPFPTDKRDLVARAAAFGGFTGLATIAGAFGVGRPDVVLAMSPPLTLGLAGWLAAGARRVPFVFNIQDVFPDVAVEVGAITSPRVIAAAERLERFCYRRAAAVTVLSDDLADNVGGKLARGLHGAAAEAARRRVHVIPNFVDTARIRPGPRHNRYRDELGLGDRTVILYAGNVGWSQSLDLLIDAADAFADRDDVVVVIHGSGSARDDLMARAAGRPNVVFSPLLPRERLGEVLAAGDVHVVPLRRGLARSSVPSKLYSILAAGRPVVASVDAGTEVARTVERAGAGLAVDPEDPTRLVEALRALVDHPERAAAMGRAGRRFVEGWASPSAVAQRYEALFDEVRGAFGAGARSM